MSEKRNIRFVDSRGEELFQVPDGGMIRQFYGNGEEHYALCRYVDDENMEIDGIQWNNRKFAEQMEKNGIYCFPA